jgi:5-methyltetrahydrofolate--homocysteine methyltransferase
MELTEIKESVINGNMKDTQDLVNQALSKGSEARVILKESLIPAMDEVGARFEKGDFFVPEMLIAARAMKAGIEILKPLLTESGVDSAGKVVIGTVKGDLHDIGKNLVGLMLEGGGFEVIDLGTDVSVEKFIEAVKSEKPHLLGMSALLTTTMTSAGEVIQALEKEGLRDQIKVMFGGAPVTQAYTEKIGADGYAPDAAVAVKKARELLKKD